MAALTSAFVLPTVVLAEEPPSTVAGAEVVAVPVLPDPSGGSGRESLGPGAAELLDELDVDLFEALAFAKATGRAGEVTSHPVLDATAMSNPDLLQVLLVGVGDGTPPDLRRAGAALARHTRGKKAVATSLAALADDAGLRALVEGLVLGSFTFHRYSSPAHDQAPVGRVVLAGMSDAGTRRSALARGLAVARAAWTARELALTPSNEKTPAWIADRAGEAAREHGLGVEVWDERALAEGGFGGLTNVGKASQSPPRLVRLDYTPRRGGRRTPRVVLVGKGITFDTGGLSIKPNEAMMNMKRDMTGAGVVLAVMTALGAVDCPVRVTGLLACAENAVGGNAMRPGDVVTQYGGRTTEVTNTDAEGRLVLADAMAYAVAELKPDVLVDVATLTGAMKIALGQHTAGFFANDDALARLLTTSGEAAGEPMWRMPLAEDYEERLSSTIADADNAAGGPGAITAALFLQHFAGGLPWAHVDIASVGDSPVDGFEYTKGATGFGARALLHWLELCDPLADINAEEK